MAGVLTALTAAFSSDWSSEDDIRSLLSTAGFSGLLMMVLGVVASAGEYRHGTIATTLLVTPDRLKVVAAKAAACALAGFGVGLVAAVLTDLVGLLWLSAKDVDLAIGAGDVVVLSFGGALYAGLAGAFGAALGSLLRNQLAAVVLVLLLIFVFDPSISALSESYSKFSLNGLGLTLSGGPAEDLDTEELLPFWLAALLWTAYTLALVTLAAALASRRDV